MSDLISRQAAIDALWKALYEYEDKTEKQFIDSEELDVADWIQHRIFVQNMSDIDRQTILGLPSAQPDLDSAYTEGYTAAESKYRAIFDEMQANIKAKAFGKRKGLIHTADIDAMPTIEYRKTGKWINAYPDIEPNPMLMYGICSVCGFEQSISDKLQYCPSCGARMVQEGEDNAEE